MDASGEHTSTTRRVSLPAALLNLTLFGVAAFLLLRPNAFLGAQLRQWRDARATRRAISEAWAELTTSGSLLGSANAKVRLVEFSDYECPACRAAHLAMKEMMGNSSAGGIVFHHLPLNIHPMAEIGARAAICSEAQGRFREMHEHLFTTEGWRMRPTWSKEALAVGITDTTAFNNCLRSSATGERIARDIALARRMGVSGTPSFVTERRILKGFVRENIAAAMRLEESR